TNNATKTALLSGAALAALGLALAPARDARADDCLLDTSNDGFASGGDTDGGANSDGDDTRLACGSNASASSPGATAVGADATASALVGSAIGYSASASGNYGTAVGYDTSAIGAGSTALGSGS